MTAAAPAAPASATGARGMVVAGHPAAARAGADVLAAGGRCADAAVAAAAVLAVVLPQACAVGGDAMVLVHDRDAGTHGLNASGPSPRAAAPDRFPDGLPQRGPASATVPGIVSGWWELHRRFGRMPWAELLAPAIGLARDGFPASAGLAAAAANYADLLRADPGCRALFLPDGRPVRPGETLRQASLAGTLETIARGSPRDFYGGAIGRAAGAFMAGAGGLLTADDLAGYRAAWVRPLRAEYKGRAVALMPPNSFGLYMALQLRALRTAGLERHDLASLARFACLIAAARAAFDVGRPLVADPAYAEASEAAVEGAAAAVERRVGAVAAALPPNRGGTATVSVADAEGNGVCLVQSVFLLFGAAVRDPATGILFHNRMIGFSADPADANGIGPGKRPAHTLNPVMVFEENELRYVMASPGGPGQTITMTQVLSALVDRRVGVEAAVAAPRWSVDLAGEALLESGVPAAVGDGLRALGIAARHAEGKPPFFGSAEVVARRPGLLHGVADGRREAAAAGA